MIPFVGRQDENAHLLAIWERARAGHAQHLLLTGEAGVGKTRLSDELAALARSDGARVLRGRCWDVGGAPAYWPWIEAFGEVLEQMGPTELVSLVTDLDPGLVQLLPRLRDAIPRPALPDEGGAEAARLRLFDAVARLLRRLAAGRPLLVVLDELESADELSLHLLRFVVRSRGNGPSMVVGMYRSPLPPEAPGAAVLASIAREPGVEHLELGGLPREEVGRLIEAITGGPSLSALASTLHQRTGGNPLFATEFLRLIASAHVDPTAVLASAPLPAGVRGLITRRLATLPAPCRALLELGAVLGREIELGTMARATGESTEQVLAALAPALDAGVLAPVPDRPLRQQFSNPLIRQAIHEGLEPAARARLHLRVAESLRAQFASSMDDHLEAIASHYVAATGMDAEGLAVEYCRRAAGRATSLASRDEAVRLLELARTLAPAVQDEGLTGEVLLELGEAKARAGLGDDARAIFLEVAGRAERLGKATLLARAALGLGGRFIWARAGQQSPEAALSERALAALPPEEYSLRARLLARLVGMQRDRRRMAETLERSRLAVEVGRRAGDHQVLAQALMAAVYIALWVDPAGARAALDELEAITRAAGDLEREQQAHDYRVNLLLNAGDVPAAEAELAASVQLAERLAQPGQRWFVSVVRAQMALLRGDLARAEALAREARAVGRSAQPRDSRMCEMIQLHAILREQQRLSELAPALDDAIEALPMYPVLPLLRLHLHLELGQPEAARSFLDQQAANGFADVHDIVQHQYMLALCAEMSERLDHRAAAAALEPLLAQLPYPHVVSPVCVFAGSVRRFQALAAATLERWQEAARGLREAARQNRAVGAALCGLRCELDLARVLSRAGGQARSTPVAAMAAQAAGAPEFRRRGEFWNIRWEDRTFQVPDAKGLRYLAALLARPGQELSALELVAPEPAASASALGGDLGPTLDPAARAAFKRRLGELAAEVASAEAASDRRRLARARAEQEALERELAAAVGLGGRARRTGDLAERARQSVTKAIKAACKRIARDHRALGQHLDASIHTGFFCRYDPPPDPHGPPPWRVEV